MKAHQAGSFSVLVTATGISISALETLGLIATGGAATGTIWAILDALRGRVIHRVEVNEQNETSKLILDDEEIECTEDVKKLVTNKTIRKEIDKLIYKPLQTELSSIVRIQHNGQAITEVNRDNSINYRTIGEPILKTIEENEEDVNIHFAKVDFLSNKTWSIILPDKSTVPATMNDETFLGRVNRNSTRFSKDDLFVVTLKTEIIRDGARITKTSYSIERVIRHRAAEEQKII